MRATKEYRLSFTEEAEKIVEKLTLEQKVSLMGGNLFAGVCINLPYNPGWGRS